MFLYQIKVLFTSYPAVYNSLIFDRRMIRISSQTFQDHVFEIDQYAFFYRVSDEMLRIFLKRNKIINANIQLELVSI